MDKNPTFPDRAPNADFADIVETIHKETVAFVQNDFDAWKQCFVQATETTDIMASPGAGLSVLSGWEAISNHMERVFRERIGGPIEDFGRDNLRLQVHQDSAWAVFESWAKTANGGRLEGYDTRVLRRIETGWKIAYSSHVQRSDTNVLGKSVGVDAERRIVWSSPGALTELEEHSFLSSDHGVLRARSWDWDRALESAVSNASKNFGYYHTQKTTQRLGGLARYPVILGPTETGGLVIAHLSVRDGMTYVLLEGDGGLERRLDHAKSVFGLSIGQVRVARYIALGNSPKLTAEKLEVSVNTVRTHLTRIYEKTGVQTQAALVRILLSVG